MATTTLPIALTTDRLIEFLAGPGLGTIRTISMDEIGRDCYAAPSPTADDSCGATMLMMALQGQSAEDIRAYLHDSDEAVAWRNRPPDPQPQPPNPDPQPPGPMPDLGVSGWNFVAGGQPWTAKQCSDFNLFARFTRGENITSILAQRQR